MQTNKKVHVQRRGNRLGIWFFEIMLRLTGLKGAYGLLYLVCLHYLIFDRAAVQNALPYVTRRFPNAGFFSRYVHVYRLFINQGKQLIDRHAIARKPEMFRYKQLDTAETLAALQESPKGVVLLTSHIGNWQVTLRQMGHLKKEISIVIRPEDNPALQDSLKLGIEAKPVKIINPEGYLGGVLEMMQDLEAGRIVCIMGDRGYGFDTLKVPFLGGQAAFPYGGFSVAAATASAVIPFFTHKISEREYIADVSNIWYPVYEKGKKKEEQLAHWVGRYAALLEAFVLEHPYDCFLFHNVWNHDKGEKSQ